VVFGVAYSEQFHSRPTLGDTAYNQSGSFQPTDEATGILMGRSHIGSAIGTRSFADPSAPVCPAGVDYLASPGNVFHGVFLACLVIAIPSAVRLSFLLLFRTTGQHAVLGAVIFATAFNSNSFTSDWNRTFHSG